MRLRDDAKGLAYLQGPSARGGQVHLRGPAHALHALLPGQQRRRAPCDDDPKDAINARTTEEDHAKLRDMIVAYVRNTGNKVLACPEMTYQVELAKEMLVDPAARRREEERRLARHATGCPTKRPRSMPGRRRWSAWSATRP